VIGTEALLQQHHRFRKTEPNARLEFEITGLTLEAIDDNAFLPTHGECPWLAPGDHDPQECATVMYASVDFTVEALGPTEGDGPTCNWVLGDECFFYEAGNVDLEGWRGTWGHDVWAPSNAMDPVWREDDFVWTPNVNTRASSRWTLRRDSLLAPLPSRGRCARRARARPAPCSLRPPSSAAPSPSGGVGWSFAGAVATRVHSPCG
jgi:hypothetical protein